MRVAICFSGQARSLIYTFSNIKEFLIGRFPGCDVFIHVAKDQYSEMYKNCLKFLEPKKLLITEDPSFDVSKVPNTQRGSLEVYYKMLNSWKCANNLRLEYEKQNKIKYDMVIRTRLDIRFFDPIPFAHEYDLEYVCIPNFHHWSVVQGHGYNDRFAVGTSKKITLLSNMIDYLPQYISEGHAVHAESTLAYHLDKHKIRVMKCPITFTRVRESGIEEDAHLRKDISTWSYEDKF